jgi:hypothetical protein
MTSFNKIKKINNITPFNKIKKINNITPFNKIKKSIISHTRRVQKSSRKIEETEEK